MPPRDSAKATAAAPTPAFPGVTAKVTATSTAARVVTATPRGCATPNARPIVVAATTRATVASPIQSPTRRQSRRRQPRRRQPRCRRSTTARSERTTASAARPGTPTGNSRGPRPIATTDAEETRGAHRGDRRRHAHRPGFLAVESEPRAAADTGWSDGVDERADPVAGDGVSPCQLRAAHGEAGAPGAAATDECRGETGGRCGEKCRIRLPRMCEPVEDGREQMAQHVCPSLRQT